MTQVWKLTDQNMQTRDKTQWLIGEAKTASGEGDLCGPGWLHAYEHGPYSALMLNPVHADFCKPRLFLAEGEIGKRDSFLKCGCTSLKLIEELPVPNITTEMRVRFAIFVVWRVYRNESWRKWARNWITKKDRSADAAHAAYAAAAHAAAYADAAHAAYAADAADAAYAAAAHAAADAADAAYAAAYADAAYAAAAHAAHAAAHAAHAADAAHAAAVNIETLARAACWVKL